MSRSSVARPLAADGGVGSFRAPESEGDNGPLPPAPRQDPSAAGGTESGRRNEESSARLRRPADLLAFVGACVAVGIGLLVAHSLPVGSEELTTNVIRLAHHLPRPLVVVCAAVAALATLVVVVLMLATLARRRPRDGLNAAVAFVLATVVGAGAVAGWHAARHGGIASTMLHGTDGSTLVRDAVIVALLTGSDMVGLPRWTKWCALSIGALIVTGVALEELTVFAAVVAPLGGWACGLITRWALTTTSLRPSIGSLTLGLQDAGIEVGHLELVPTMASELIGSLADGSQISITLAGRDARGAGVARRIWSVLRLRGAVTGRQPLSVRSALETEALAALLAAKSGVAAPRVLLLANFEPDTLVLVRALPGGEPLGRVRPEEALPEKALPGEAPAEEEAGGGIREEEAGGALDEAAATALWRALRQLHQAGVAHRDLQAENLTIGSAVGAAGAGAVGAVGAGAGASGPMGASMAGFRSLRRATVGAGDLVRRLDAAQLLTTIGSLAGPGVAVRALRAGYESEPDDERSLAAVLQPLALGGWGWTRMRAARGCLAEVRHELLGSESGAAEVRLERFRWRTVVGAIAMMVAAFLLVGQLKKVNLVGALSHADLTWFGIALIASALTYVGSTINLVAFVPKRVSVVRGTLVELSGAFLGLVTPPTVGHVAVNARYLRKQGLDAGETAAAVAVSQVVNFLITIVLLLVTVLLTGTGSSHLSIVPGPRLLAVLGGLVVVFGVFMAIPFGRDLVVSKLWPRVRGALPQLLDVLSQPARLLVGIGGNLLLTASYVAALIASLHAVGAHPPIIATAAVYMAGNAVGTAAPTPGGIGAVEAVMAAALAAIGVPAHEAVPGVLIFRLATFWFPILPGWVTFVVLQRTGTL